MPDKKKVVCPKCGGNLVYEAIGSYGQLYHVCKNGKIGRQLKVIKYEGSGDAMLYCLDCGTNYDFRLTQDGVELKGNDDE